MGKAKINSSKVGIDGKPINAHLPTYRKKNPGAIIFDSKGEWKHWRMLCDAGHNVVLKPEPLVLLETGKGITLDHLKFVKKTLRSNLRDAVCKEDKSWYRRETNKKFSKVLKSEIINPITWAPDFYLPELHLYIESKGHPNELFPVKLKWAQKKFTDQLFAVVNTQKDMQDLLLFLDGVNSFEELKKKISVQ